MPQQLGEAREGGNVGKGHKGMHTTGSGKYNEVHKECRSCQRELGALLALAGRRIIWIGWVGCPSGVDRLAAGG